MSRKKIFVFLAMLVLAFFSLKNTQADSLTKASNLYPIHELNKQKVSFGTYEVKAYVLKRQDNALIISDENIPQEINDLSDSELTVFVPNVKEFEIGQYYKFLIQVLDVKSTKQKLNNMKAVHWEKIIDKVDVVLDNQS